MSKRIRLAVAALAVLAGAACEGANAFTGNSFGTSSLPTGSGTGGIAGQVSAGGTGRSGVVVVVTGRDSTVTDLDGFYRFISVPTGTYIVTLRVPSGFALPGGDSGNRNVTVTSG